MATGAKNDLGIIRLDLPGWSGAKSLQHIPWPEWFRQFDENNLALLVQEKTPGGEQSNFSKLVSRGTVKAARRGPRKQRAGGGARKRSAKRGARRQAARSRSASSARGSRRAASGKSTARSRTKPGRRTGGAARSSTTRSTRAGRSARKSAR